MKKTDDKKDFKRGVFWIVDGELLAIPYDEDAAEGLSKNRANYNHRLLWPEVRPEKCSRSYDYYPRGRVEYTPYGKPVACSSSESSVSSLQRDGSWPSTCCASKT